MRKNWLRITTGFIIAIMISFIVYCEGRLILHYLFDITNTFILIGISILSGLMTFILVLRNIRYKMTLSKFYLYSILLSLVFVVLVMWLISMLFSQLIVTKISLEDWSTFFQSKIGMFLGYNLFFIVSLTLAGVFGLIFSLLTKRKVRYITYISREIKNMERKGLDHSLSIKGNDELSELSRSINHMAESLLHKEEKEKQLITNISHDLRSPMTSILGYVDLLKQNGTKDPEKFNEYIEVVDRRLHSMNKMINELFELSKLSENGARLCTQKQDMILLLRQLAQENEILFEQSDLHLISSIPESSLLMEIDAEKFARAIQNLLDNAAKYAVKHTDVRLDVVRLEDEFVIELSNQFDQKHTPNIHLLFDRFYKEDVSRNNTNSSGLGLAIVERIVQLHRGVVEAEVNDNEIRFRIILPL